MKGRATKYSAAELDWIKAHATDHRPSMHAAFVERFGRDDVSLSNLNALCKRRGWMTGRTGCFPRGHAPHNKGRKGYIAPGSEKGWFKPGNVPHTYRGAGHEFTCPKDGYIYLIIDDARATTKTKTRRVLKHKYLWEQANGPLPDDQALKCLDGDRTNCDPANWEPVPRAMLPLLNGRWQGMHYDSAPDALKPTIMATAKLRHRIKTAREGNSK